MNVTIDDDAINEALRNLLAQAGGERLLKKAVFDLQRRIRMNLGQGKTPWGTPFAPLSKLTVNGRFRMGKRYTKGGATTAKFYRHMTGNHVPLNDTRQHIYNRINGVVNGRQGFIGIMDSQNAKIGRVHQFGAVIKAKRAKYLAIPVGGGIVLKKSVKIPARPFLPIRPSGRVDLPQDWQKDLEAILLRDLGQS